ncbi:MAG: SHOCT domain-containing protein [Caulobacteraceae bacterium]
MTQAIAYPAEAPDTGSGTAWEQLQTLLVAGEVVVAHALQHRLYALFHRRRLAAATSGRFIFMVRPFLGGYEPLGVRWQDLKEVSLTVGMFSATVAIAYSANLSDTAVGEAATRVIRATGLCREAAQGLYRECQAQEQSWREKRRVRALEEMRAEAGGVQIATGVYPQRGAEPALDLAPGSLSPVESPAQRLRRAREMLAQGLITDSEYEAVKAKIVGAL